MLGWTQKSYVNISLYRRCRRRRLVCFVSHSGMHNNHKSICYVIVILQAHDMERSLTVEFELG